MRNILFLILISTLGHNYTFCMEDPLEQARLELAKNPYALHDATRNNDLKKARKLLAAGADVYAPDKFGWSPLNIATWEGYKDFTELLIEYQADVNYRRSGFDLTPLYLAVLQNHQNIAEFLIDHGASVTEQDNARITPLHCVTSLSMLKTLLFYHHTPAQALPLERLCLRFICSQAFTKTYTVELTSYPEIIQKIIKSEQERQKKELAGIQSALVIKSPYDGKTARDRAADSKKQDIVDFIDRVLEAKTLDDLRVLGYHDKV